MSIKIKISYTNRAELAAVLKALEPYRPKCKLKPAAGKYWRAYVELEKFKD